jgi:hypothetical protein
MKLTTAVLFAVALTFVTVSPDRASAADRRSRFAPSTSNAPSRGPLMTTPTTILPRGEDIRAVPAPGGGRLIGYGVNLHPGGRAVRMLLNR